MQIVVLTGIKDICGQSVSRDSVVCRILDCVGVRPLISKTGNYSLIPNPNSGKFEISTRILRPKTKLRILDSKGRESEVLSLSSENKSFDLSSFPAGLYFIRIQNDESVENIRWLKE